MLRNARHNKILELIEEKEIETQEELCKELAEANFAVTQATVSRDVRELRLANAGVIIDMLKYSEIVGSIAGDDTVFSLCKTAEDAETVRGRLERLAGN